MLYLLLDPDRECTARIFEGPDGFDCEAELRRFCERSVPGYPTIEGFISHLETECGFRKVAAVQFEVDVYDFIKPEGSNNPCRWAMKPPAPPAQAQGMPPMIRRLFDRGQS